MVRYKRFHRLPLCAAVAALVYLTGLGRPALWEPDEGRYAEVAREMVMGGDYVTPRNDWVRYFEKPPLVYWATAAAIKVFGRNEFAVRLQAALASVGQVAVTEALGEAMFDASVGMLGALALALSPLFFGFAHFATPDPALAFFLTTALASFYAAARSADFRHGPGRNWMMLAAAMLALGTLVKGPVALVLGGAIALLWLIAQRRIHDALRIPWLECIAVYLAITLPWFVIVARRNPGFLGFFFVHEHLQRYLEDTEHAWGPWFFIPVVVGGTWPWFYFVPFGVSYARGGGKANKPMEWHGALRFLLIWFGLIFVFFSIPHSKLGEYILPAIPPLAILAGCGLASLAYMPLSRARRICGWFAMLNAAIALGVVIATIAGMHSGLPPALAADAIATAASLLIGGSAAYMLARKEYGRAATVASIGLCMVIAMGAAMRAQTDAASMFSYRNLAGIIAPYSANGCVLTSYHHFVQALPFYTGAREKLVGYRGELAPFSESADAGESFIATDAGLETLWASGRCVVLIANRNDLTKLEHILDPAPSMIGCEGKKFALTNRAAASADIAGACGENKANKN
jgi:4-amino-4-deoxy-L-arabinose transferase-like glycosyltransferase